MFLDRNDAANALARALRQWRGTRPLVVAIPRGAVPMSASVARQLEGDLDVVLVRKLGAPGNPELAIGAVDETGWTYVAPIAETVGADADYIAQQLRHELATIRQRRARYTPGRASLDPHGRVVIVVDDGLATGATMIAALHALRARSPRTLICAVPVASREAIAAVRSYADEVVCVETPADFYAVGQAYLNFSQVSDDEVMRVLDASTNMLHGDGMHATTMHPRSPS
jgi:predicted phosphoribosyltransferase